MSLAQFERVLKSAGLRSNDRIRFERWMDGYRRFCRADRSERIPLDRDSLVAFLLEQKARGRKVWQRLQIVKADSCRTNWQAQTWEHREATRRVGVRAEDRSLRFANLDRQLLAPRYSLAVVRTRWRSKSRRAIRLVRPTTPRCGSRRSFGAFAPEEYARTDSHSP